MLICLLGLLIYFCINGEQYCGIKGLLRGEVVCVFFLNAESFLNAPSLSAILRKVDD